MRNPTMNIATFMAQLGEIGIAAEYLRLKSLHALYRKDYDLLEQGLLHLNMLGMNQRAAILESELNNILKQEVENLLNTLCTERGINSDDELCEFMQNTELTNAKDIELSILLGTMTTYVSESNEEWLTSLGAASIWIQERELVKEDIDDIKMSYYAWKAFITEDGNSIFSINANRALDMSIKQILISSGMTIKDLRELDPDFIGMFFPRETIIVKGRSIIVEGRFPVQPPVISPNPFPYPYNPYPGPYYQNPGTVWCSTRTTTNG